MDSHRCPKYLPDPKDVRIGELEEQVKELETRLSGAAQGAGKPLAWRYELAHARNWLDDKTLGDYTNWRWHVSETEPHAGDAMRNVTPLYALPSTSRCTCAAEFNPNIPHARTCPLSSPEQK